MLYNIFSTHLTGPEFIRVFYQLYNRLINIKAIETQRLYPFSILN